jgi:hypothetical protein
MLGRQCLNTTSTIMPTVDHVAQERMNWRHFASRRQGTRNRNDKHDTVLYDALKEKLQQFITLDRLIEVSHGLDTQVNESFNQSASWFAPKNKVYCASMSLTNRLSMAVGINTLGVSEYSSVCSGPLAFT